MALFKKPKKVKDDSPQGWLIKMDPEVKQLWILALRSKLYFQGDVHLRKKMQDVDRYDALGVLCDLYAQEMGEKWVYHSETSNFSLHGCKHLLPEQVAKWAGLKRNCCLPIILDGEKKLFVDMTMEDDYKFDQIADVIEKCF